MNDFPYISVMMGLPAVTAFFLLFSSPRISSKKAILPGVSVFVSLLISFYVLIKFFFNVQGEPAISDERYAWFSDIGSFYHVGVDGLSIWFIVLTLFVGFIALAWSITEGERSNRFYIYFLLLISSCTGIFAAKDLFLFVFLWGLSVFPMHMLVNGEYKRRQSPILVKSFIFHFSGYLLMIVAISMIYISASRTSGSFSFEIDELARATIPITPQKWVFWLLFIGLASRMALFPLHSWLADIIVETPGAVCAFILAVVLKTGMYAFVRICLMFCPDAVIDYQSVIIYVSFVSILYGALISLVHPDIRKIISFSTMSFTGLALLSVIMLNGPGIDGGMMIALNHGFLVILLYLIMAMLKRTFGSVIVQDYGGVSQVCPGLSGLFFISMFAYIGVPGSGLFPALFEMFHGIILAQPFAAFIAGAGIIIGSIALLSLGQKLFRGSKTNLIAHYHDSQTGKNWFWGIPILIFSFWLGFFPSNIYRAIDTSTLFIQSTLKSHILLKETEREKSWSPLQHFFNPRFNKENQDGNFDR